MAKENIKVNFGQRPNFLANHDEISRMKKISLSRKLLFIVLAVSSVATTFTSAVQMYLEYSSEMDLQNEDISLFEKSSIPAINEYVWIFNYDMIATIAKSSLKNPNFVSFDVVDGAGKTVAHEAKSEKFRFVKQVSFDLKNPSDPLQKTGEVHLVIADDLIYAKLEKKLITIVGTNLLKTAFVSFALLMFFNLYAVGPIQTIARQLINNDWQNPKSINIKRQKVPIFGQDEDELTEMVATLNESIEIVRAHNKLVRNQIESAESKVNETAEKLESTQRMVLANAHFAELGAFATGVAHEVNNPLTIIMGMAWGIEAKFKKGSLTNESLEVQLKSIREASERIRVIVHGLKMYASDSSQDDLSAVVVSELFASVASMSHAMNRAVEIPIEFIVHNDSRINCQVAQINRAIINLINNSYDAIADLSERWIRIEATSDSKTNEALILITDSGKGISNDVVDKIFNPFFTTKEVGRGTGLGLSIVHGILQSHKAKIFVNQDFANTQFVIKFPLAQSNHEAPPDHKAVA